MVAHIRRFVLFGSICRRIIKVLTSGTHLYAVTGLGTDSAPGPIGTGPGTKPVGTLCQPSIDIPNVNTGNTSFSCSRVTRLLRFYP